MKDRDRNRKIVIVYPFVVAAISLALNVLLFGVEPLAPALPATQCLIGLSVAGILLAINHSWLMTETELTRIRFDMYATAEEWAAAGKSPDEATPDGIRAVEQVQSMHRNITENTVHFAVLAGAFVLASPPPLAATVWLIGFGVARLGYTASYLAGNVNTRGGFMTLTLLSLYGMATYLAIAIVR